MRNYTVTSVWGIPIRISISLVVFLPILAWLIGSGGQITVYSGVIESIGGGPFNVEALQSGSMPWVIGVLAAVGLFISVTLHELGHSWVALRYGLTIESITLWILGGIAALSSIPREWNREFWIAIAGPITSVLVAGGCYLIMLVIPQGFPVLTFVFGWLAIVNLTLVAFNLLPAFPMDGGRILRALLARSRPYGSATRIAGRIGVIFAILFAVVGVLGFNVILILLAFFIYGAATTESRTVLLDELLEGITIGDIMTRDPRTVDGDLSVAKLAERMLRDRQTVYPVTDESGQIIGVATLADIRDLARDKRETTTVRSVMHEAPQLEGTADAFDTLAMLQQLGSPVALVVERESLAGVLSQEDYARAFSLQREFQAGVPR
ncbi:MAG: site-2 protease family protein [Halobacteriales archaeon]|nr:site-2 protease family protein [Halobacteriales archaeon]